MSTDDDEDEKEEENPTDKYEFFEDNFDDTSRTGLDNLFDLDEDEDE